MKKKELFIFYVTVVLLNTVILGGCATLDELFRRKKPTVKDPTAGLQQVINYRRRYRDSYILWRVCQEELLENLGRNRKKDLRLCYVVVEYLETMQDCLKQEKALEIARAVQKVRDATGELVKRRLSRSEMQQLKRFLSREGRIFQKEFSYNKMQDWIKPNVRYVNPDYLGDDKD